MKYNLSIIVPIYNYGHYVERVVNSLNKQTINDFEVIFVNDGSTDDTQMVLKQLSTSFRFQYKLIEQVNQGRAAACWTGANHADHSWLLFLDADDYLLENAVEIFTEAVRNDSETAVFFADHETFLEGTSIVKRSKNLPLTKDPYLNVKNYLILKKLSFANGAYIVRKDIIKNYFFDFALRIAEDISFKVHLLANCQCKVLNQNVLRVYRHVGSMRSNDQIYFEQKQLIVDKIFDREKLPQDFFALREHYQERIQFSLFRMLFKNKKYQKSILVYMQIIASRPFALLKFKYLFNFIRSLFYCFLPKIIKI